MRTCQFCGAAAEYTEPAADEAHQAVSPVAQAVPAGPVPAQPAVNEVPPAKAGRPSNSGLKKLLLYYAVATIGGVIVLIVGLRIVAFISGSQSGVDSPNTDTSRSQSITAASGAVSASELGVDVYPGAQAASDGDRSTSADSIAVSQSFVSSDEMDRVVDFYKKRMVGFASIYASGQGIVVSIRPSQKESVQVTLSPARSGGKTSIFISHTTARSAN